MTSPGGGVAYVSLKEGTGWAAIGDNTRKKVTKVAVNTAEPWGQPERGSPRCLHQGDFGPTDPSALSLARPGVSQELATEIPASNTTKKPWVFACVRIWLLEYSGVSVLCWRAALRCF